jgi:hypothetical protein
MASTAITRFVRVVGVAPGGCRTAVVARHGARCLGYQVLVRDDPAQLLGRADLARVVAVVAGWRHVWQGQSVPLVAIEQAPPPTATLAEIAAHAKLVGALQLAFPSALMVDPLAAGAGDHDVVAGLLARPRFAADGRAAERWLTAWDCAGAGWLAYQRGLEALEGPSAPARLEVAS